MLVVSDVESKYKYNDQHILSPPTDCLTWSISPTTSTYLNLISSVLYNIIPRKEQKGTPPMTMVCFSLPS